MVTDATISLFKGLHFGHMKEYPSSGESWEKRLVTPEKGICHFCSPKKGCNFKSKIWKKQKRDDFMAVCTGRLFDWGASTASCCHKGAIRQRSVRTPNPPKDLRGTPKRLT